MAFVKFGADGVSTNTSNVDIINNDGDTDVGSATLTSSSHTYLVIANMSQSAVLWDIGQQAFNFYKIGEDSDEEVFFANGSEVLKFPARSIDIYRVTSSGSHSMEIGIGSVTSTHKSSSVDGDMFFIKRFDIWN